MTIPVFDRTLPALAEAVNHAARTLSALLTQTGDLPWGRLHREREAALQRAHQATQAFLIEFLGLEPGSSHVAVAEALGAYMLALQSGDANPAPGYLPIVDEKLKSYQPDAPENTVLLLQNIIVVDGAAKAHNAAYIPWHDGLDDDQKRIWDRSGGTLSLRGADKLTEDQARPFREEFDASGNPQSPGQENWALLRAFQAVGG